VIYHAAEVDDGQHVDLPAVVTHVWETSVNLAVLKDGSYFPSEIEPVLQKTSVAEGTEVGQWSWPVMVPAGAS